MTNKRTLANRRNAARSTGPKTPTGKRASSSNALTHGLTAARDALVPSEDGEALDALASGVIADLDPVGTLEADLAVRVVTCAWRLRRVVRVETALFEGEPSGAWQHDCTYHEPIGKLSRYEGALERSLFRALHELQRLQAVRRGQHVPAPVAVDVTIAEG